MKTPEAVLKIMRMEQPLLTSEQIAPVLGAKTFSIHSQSVEDPKKLGFPVTQIGNRVMIPRIPFLRYLGYEPDDTGDPTEVIR